MPKSAPFEVCYNRHAMQFSFYNTFPSELEVEWNTLLERSVVHVPFLRHEYLNAWWQTRGGGEWPQAELWVVTGRQNGELVGVAPFFLANNPQGQPALFLLGSVEISDYLDIICEPEKLDVFLSELLPELQSVMRDRFRSLELYNLLESSPTLTALQKAAAKLNWHCMIEPLQHSPYIELPGDWETYLGAIDKKQRHEIRRKMRRAEESDRNVRWYIVTDGSTLEAEIDAFLGLMELDAEKAKFLTEPMQLQMRLAMRCAFDRNCLQLIFLEVDGEKAAGYLNFDYLNQIWVYNSCIDQRFRELSPGWVLLGYLLQWSNQNKRRVLDFMRGDEEYKYRFGAQDRRVMKIIISPNQDHFA